MDVWDLYDDLADRDPAALTEAQRDLVAICVWRQEVNSGGFDAYFTFSGGDSAERALTAAGDLLGPAWADLLGEAMALLGTPYPADPDDRADIVEERDLDDALNTLDERYYDLEASENADKRLNRHLRAHPELTA